MHTVDHSRPSRQRGPHNDPSMLDGDSAHGNPGEPAGDEWAVDTDTDVVDESAEDEVDDAVADPAPESEDEIEEFEAGAEPDAVTAAPPAAERVMADEDEDEEEVDEEEDADEEEMEDEVEDEDEEEEAEDEEEPDAVAGSEAIPAATADTPVEAELHRPAQPDPERADELAPPIDGYDALTVPQVLAKVDGLEVGQLNAVLEYERSHRNRKTLVAKLGRLTSEA